jgi:hypothetical protein
MLSCRADCISKKIQRIFVQSKIFLCHFHRVFFNKSQITHQRNVLYFLHTAPPDLTTQTGPVLLNSLPIYTEPTAKNR